MTWTVGDTRRAVFARDGGCVAPRIDPQAGPCYNRNGEPLRAGDDLEMDRVRDAPSMGKAPSHLDVTRNVAMCPGHHRGAGPNHGRQWATAHRPELRDYLDSKHPERRDG